MHSQSTSLPLTLYVHSAARVLGQSRGRGGALTGRSLDGSRPSYTTIVLLFTVRTGYGLKRPFSPKEVVAWAREELGLELDRRRVHEALQYLDVVYERVARGKYVVKDEERLHVELAKRLTGLSRTGVRCNRVATPAEARGSCARRRGARGRGARRAGLVWDGGCVVLLRDHMDVVRGRRFDVVGLLLGLFRALSFKARLYRWVVGFVRRLLRAMGVSHYLVRRVTREASRLFGEVRRRGKILVGGHGCVDYDKRGRCVRDRFYPLEELMRLVAGDNGKGLWFQEFGFDVVMCPEKPGGSVDVEEASGLVHALREVIGHSDVYAAAPRTGSRR